MPRGGVGANTEGPISVRAGPTGAGRLPRRRRVKKADAATLAASGIAGSKADWARLAKQRLKGELARTDIRYAELAARLTRMGVPETEGSLQVKISRGAFSAWFLLAALKALGVETLRLE